MIDRRHFLVAAVVLPLPGLLRRRTNVFALPTPAWRALASATLTARRVVIAQDVSARSAVVMAHVITDCPDDLAFYVNLYFGIHEPTPGMEAGRLWIADVRRLEELCAFLRRGGCVVEQDDEWTVLTRRA